MGRACVMTMPAVLAIGLDPRFADYSAMRQFTPEIVGAYIEAEIDRLRKIGFEVDTSLIAPDVTAESDVEAALRSKGFA